ncbi:MAG: glycosylase, partial [Lachnospiraceae bacterium]|nr:glycosylase [Lachnospiraceae bacterium]
KDGKGDITRFLNEYLPAYTATKDEGYYCLITCNHDTRRPKYSLDDDELKIAYTFLFTMPGVPFLYYGDEIGMRYLDVMTKEGGYARTSSRTPMQWDGGKNDGFST